ncbi:peptidoglycan DD-metalloendopeptidase family protein [Leeuwenhoekiella polynyae]|uniref:Murein DD-endopeptidase MepM/ murein hydrolase activator NlpD n=1 Tax=Leeuwenhoekiella polynyae TaxID=1550906 RepID=A0A4Q0PHG5_9FLAO|nr:M23 family metallopeptidase [Leeuwenhoekiella polynyae]RXG26333.1 murein DD-endopeptidase MepM/ murein hydrolase activator NlpD [Leeuwenhoekiella polynyae]
MLNNQKVYFGLIGLLLFASCSKLTKATDFITQPTAREVYARNFESDSLPYIFWNMAFKEALQDSLHVNSPYQEMGIFNPKINPVYAYELYLERGRNYDFSVLTDTINPLVFIDLYEKTSDSISPFKLEEQAAYEQSTLNFSPKKSAIFKVVFQPQLNAASNFTLTISSTPGYSFPVAGISSKAIQSYWGAPRDGGKRSHEGVDIFASRGTPVLASVAGKVSRTGNLGLGGKQVWLRDGLLGNSLYYAHLDSIIVTNGQRVKIGDTLGLVGNTGNARTTPPHLHFGVYSRGSGAINPLPFVKEEAKLADNQKASEIYNRYLVKSVRANLRSSASAKSQQIGSLTRLDTVNLLGETADWLHVETSTAKRAFVHKSLVTPL